MSHYLTGWMLWGCGVLPSAMALLSVVRRDESIAEQHEAPVAILLALLWPGVLVVLIAATLAGVFSVMRDSRMWWALAYMATRPLYRLHMWCGARLTSADDRKGAERALAEKEQSDAP